MKDSAGSGGDSSADEDSDDDDDRVTGEEKHDEVCLYYMFSITHRFWVGNADKSALGLGGNCWNTCYRFQVGRDVEKKLLYALSGPPKLSAYL